VSGLAFTTVWKTSTFFRGKRSKVFIIH